MQQAIHIVRYSDSDYWYLAANYDLLNDEMRGFVDVKTFVSESFITFEGLRSHIRRAEGFYMDTVYPPEVEVVMDMLLTNYNTQVAMLRKADRYV